jgi:hypothetical protein
VAQAFLNKIKGADLQWFLWQTQWNYSAAKMYLIGALESMAKFFKKNR